MALNSGVSNPCPHKSLSVALLLTCPPLKWEHIREGQKSVIDNCVIVFWFLLLAHVSPCRSERLSLTPCRVFSATKSPLWFKTGPERPDEKGRRSYLCGRAQTQQKWRVRAGSEFSNSQNALWSSDFGSSEGFCFVFFKCGRVCISQRHEECHLQAWRDRTEWTQAENLWGQQKVSCFFFLTQHLNMLVFPVEMVHVLCIDIKTHNFSNWRNLREGSGAAYILITCQQLKKQINCTLICVLSTKLQPDGA